MRHWYVHETTSQCPPSLTLFCAVARHQNKAVVEFSNEASFDNRFIKTNIKHNTKQLHLSYILKMACFIYNMNYGQIPTRRALKTRCRRIKAVITTGVKPMQ